MNDNVNQNNIEYRTSNNMQTKNEPNPTNKIIYNSNLSYIKWSISSSNF